MKLSIRRIADERLIEPRDVRRVRGQLAPAVLLAGIGSILTSRRSQRAAIAVPAAAASPAAVAVATAAPRRMRRVVCSACVNRLTMNAR